MLAIICVVSAALVFGAVWGLWLGLSARWEGILLAVAGGALTHAAVAELLEPGIAEAGLLPVAVVALFGAALFTALDRWIDRCVAGSAGFGLMLAILLDGIPENLALGVTLIGATPQEAAALAGAIFLSNLPEAAGGAREMKKDSSSGRILAIWSGTAALLAAAAWLGNVALEGIEESALRLIDAFAGGAVIASLATEVFPKAFREGHWSVGISVAVGLLMALGLGTLG